MRKTTGVINILVAATSYTAWTLGLGRRAVIRKIRFHNRTGGNGVLRIGYTTLAAAFVQVLPDITMLNGLDDAWDEEHIPIGGNYPEGFAADTTAGTGTLGDIIIRSDVGGAIPNDVQVTLEVEEEPIG